MAEQTVEQLQKRIKDLESQKGTLIKTGKVIFLHLPDSVGDKGLRIIEGGLDCGELFNGAWVDDMIPFQVSTFNKNVFPKFERILSTEAPIVEIVNPDQDVKVGDTIEVMLKVGGRSVSKNKQKGDRDIIYSNNNIIKYRVIERGGDAPKPSDQGAETTDDAPF